MMGYVHELEYEEATRVRGNRTAAERGCFTWRLCRRRCRIGGRFVPALVSSANRAAGEPEPISCKPVISQYDKRIDERQAAHSSEKSQPDSLPDRAKYFDTPDDCPIFPLRVNHGAELG